LKIWSITISLKLVAAVRGRDDGPAVVNAAAAKVLEPI
jgi:hypothetical protein